MKTIQEISDLMYSFNDQELWIVQHELNQLKYACSQYESDEIQTKTYNQMKDHSKTITPELKQLYDADTQRVHKEELEWHRKDNPEYPFDNGIPF